MVMFSTYKIKFIDSFRFMSSSLLSLFDNLSEGIHNDKCIHCKSCLECLSIEDNKLMCKCIDCNKNYKKDYNKDLINRFAYEFCNKDIKFILLLRKGVYPYEYIDSWERFNEKSLLNGEEFYSSLNMEDNTDFDYRHAKRHGKSLK